MTDSINAVVVVLDENVREDDMEPLLTALRQMRNVANVIPHTATFEDVMAVDRARIEFSRKVYGALREALE